MPEFMPCLDANCPGGYIHETADAESVSTCEICMAKYCMACDVPWHTDQTCEECAENLTYEALR
jgi:hypothetical protein